MITSPCARGGQNPGSRDGDTPDLGSLAQAQTKTNIT